MKVFWTKNAIKYFVIIVNSTDGIIQTVETQTDKLSAA
jgi:hypothetical protein